MPKDFAAERARLKKGKVLGRRRSIDGLTQTIDNLVLPNITTTQLTQNCETAYGSWKQARQGMNGREKKSLHQIAKRGRLRDGTFALEVNGGSRVGELEGLLVSKLNFQSECTEESQAHKPRKQQHSRLSKTDSGFYEDSGDNLITHSVPSSPNQDSDKASNTTNNSITSIEKGRKITLDLKVILNQDKTVVRNTEKLTARANMCVQSHQSLHADLVAFKSLSTHPHKGTISNCSFQTNRHCVKLREVVLKTRTNIYDDGIKQLDTSLAVLKTRRRLLDKRNSTCPPFPCMERRNKERSTDLSRATCNCKRRVHFSDAKQFDHRQCVSCPVDLRASQTRESQIKSVEGNEYPRNEPNPEEEVNRAVSSSGLTETALFNAWRLQETVDVNAKCQEWLNRCIAFNSAPYPVMESLTVPLDSLVERQLTL